MSKNVLVTGGAGYIGSHTCKILDKNGYNPIVYDNLSRGNKWAVKWGNLVVGDIINYRKLSRAFNKYNPIGVIHFAAYAYVGESIDHPKRYYRNNVKGTINLLEAMIDNNIDNIIFSSTCATYGEPNNIPISEGHPQNPINPYGKSKYMIEKIMNDYSEYYDFNHVSLRYFNAAGADTDTEIGEAHDPETHLIPLVIKAANGEKENIEIYGTDYDTKDGTCVRDYIHVNDLGRAHLMSMEHLIEGGGSEIFNIGNGEGYSVKEIINAVEKVSNQKINRIESDRRKGDPAVLIADNSKIKGQLNWSPKIKDIESIIETVWKWQKNRSF